MAVFSHPMFDAHQQVLFCHDAPSGLRAIIAIHDTRLGPAVGGCRMWPYASDEDALTDALRLSRGMTYKNALADLPFGGGKAVIIGDPHKDKSSALWRALANFLNGLGGRYITAEDMGTSPGDIDQVHRYSPHVTGLAEISGDPSPFTALGVYQGIRAAVKHRLGRDDLAGLRVAVQGAGHVGLALCRLLHQAGCQLMVADPDKRVLDRAAAQFQAVPVAPDAIYGQDVDIYAPCALGATLNDQTIDILKARIVAGSANNQLAAPRHDRLLFERGILYAPDYVINAGGIINVSFEPDYDANRSRQRIERLYGTLLQIFCHSQQQARPTGAVADALARRKLEGTAEHRQEEICDPAGS